MDIEINCVDKFYVQKMHETGVEHAFECTFSNLESNFFSRSNICFTTVFKTTQSKTI